MNETQFEQFCFDLLTALKFVNLDWRKGTPKKTSPANSGRDIFAQHLIEDVDGSKHLETWFVDCKHFKRAVPALGGHPNLNKLGEDVSETLEFVPEHFKVIRTVLPKLSCTRCDCIVQEPAPHRPIARGLAGPGLLAHVLVAKYCDHLPLSRQSEIYERRGIELDRSTLADWVGGASRSLELLVEALRKYVLGGTKLHGDDIPVPVLAPGNGKTKTGRLWTYVRDDRPAGSTDAPAVWFAFSPDRKWEHPFGHLQTFRGTLQADGYAGFN